MFTTATAFVERLSSIEKITIRAACTEERLDWLFSVMHRYEFALPADEARREFNAAVKILREDFAAASLTPGGF